MEEYRNYSPRAAYRGSAVRHGRRRSALNLYLTLGTAVLAAIGSLLSVNVFFNLSPEGLYINGAELYSAEQIQYVGGIISGQNLVRMNTGYIERRIKDNLIYVDEVSVEKDYPNGLVVNIVEAKEAAQIEEDGLYYTLSESGRLLETGISDRNNKLPLIVGYELLPLAAGADAESSDPQKTEILKEIFSCIGSLGFERINKIDISDRTDITLTYDGRIELKLGSSVNMELKLSDIKAVIDSGELPDSYEGTLRYTGADSGVSARPKEIDVPKLPPPSSSDTDSSSAADAYGEQDIYNTDSSEQSYDDYGYGYDDYGYGYDDYGYGYNDYNNDYNYDYGNDYNNDYGYGYDENYTDYGYNDYGYEDYYY